MWLLFPAPVTEKRWPEQKHLTSRVVLLPVSRFKTAVNKASTRSIILENFGPMACPEVRVYETSNQCFCNIGTEH